MNDKAPKYNNKVCCIDCDAPANKYCSMCGNPLCDKCYQWHDGICDSCAEEDEDYAHATHYLD